MWGGGQRLDVYVRSSFTVVNLPGEDEELKTRHLYSAFSWELTSKAWLVLTTDHAVLPATHTFIHKCNAAFTPQPQRISTFSPVLIVTYLFIVEKTSRSAIQLDTFIT